MNVLAAITFNVLTDTEQDYLDYVREAMLIGYVPIPYDTWVIFATSELPDGAFEAFLDQWIENHSS